jgi:hypothetical protein
MVACDAGCAGRRSDHVCVHAGLHSSLRVEGRGWVPVLSSHALDVSSAIALGEALDRLPNQLVILTVEAEDTGHGVGLTQKVAGAAQEAVADVVAEITHTELLSGQGLSR